MIYRNKSESKISILLTITKFYYYFSKSYCYQCSLWILAYFYQINKHDSSWMKTKIFFLKPSKTVFERKQMFYSPFLGKAKISVLTKQLLEGLRGSLLKTYSSSFTHLFLTIILIVIPYLGWFEWVIRRKVNSEKEYSSLIWWVRGAHNSRLKKIIIIYL